MRAEKRIRGVKVLKESCAGAGRVVEEMVFSEGERDDDRLKRGRKSKKVNRRSRKIKKKKKKMGRKLGLMQTATLLQVVTLAKLTWQSP